ncbi:MAG: hypothetical protein U9M99_03515 [Thermoproteota archaeon]|uniref:Uncharacterized protein n=1 Tax=uncultured marine thaumarchaeote KM3_86_D01 TaxID=1456320 RepID=A0A075HZN8_9ARCH|nr:hypothetical protein [uncultured marine thaumarchaeote KM3_86_D01]MEA2044432.1 hypothetical protein [Thermoproteota archaeon]
MMNKLLVFFSLFLIASMGFVTIPNIIHADSQLDILVKITQNTKEHIKNEIDKMTISQYEKVRAEGSYDEGTRETILLTQAVENGDTKSAKQHFISAMIAFKRASLVISEPESQETPQIVTSVHSQTIKKYENNIKKLKLISAKLNTDVDFEQIDQLLALAKANIAKGSIEQTKEVLSKISSEGKQIQKLLYEISEQNRIHKAKQFVQKHAERINSLILQAKTFGLEKTANDLQQSHLQLLQANTTSQIKHQFKIIIIYQQKVEQVKETSQAGLLRLQSLLVPLEKKAQSLTGDLKENSAAEHFLKKAFSLIEEAKQDIKDLEYAPGGTNAKYLDLTIGKKIQTIKDLLLKVEKLIYVSS